MKTAFFMLLCSVVAVLPRPAGSQTLDELQHPLLPKGKAAAAADYELYAIEHLAGAIGGSTAISYLQPQDVLFPQVRVGVARNLEIRVDAINQFPTPFADPCFAWFSEGGHAFYTTTIRSIRGSAVYRPKAGVELRGAYGWGRSRDDLRYSSTPVIEIYDSETGSTNVVSMAGTWLSARDALTHPVQADLDGLHHPLLGRRQWAIDGEVTRRWYDYGFRSTGDPGFNVHDTAQSTDTRLWLGVTHGLARGLQVHADTYWHPPFRATTTSQGTSKWMGKTTVTTTESWTRYEGVYGWRLNAIWRPNQQGELFLEGTREQEGVAQDFVSRTGVVQTSRTTTMKFGGRWLSRRPTRSRPLVADLAGLYHPFVEPGQLKVDTLVSHFGYDGDRFAPGAWLWRLQATTAVWSWMQASAYGGMMIVERVPSPLTGSAEIPNRYNSMGAQLTLRLFGRLDAFGSLHLHPAAFFTVYPVFILGRDDPIYVHRDVFAGDLGEDRTLHVGLRLLF